MPARNSNADSLKFGENWNLKFYIKTGGQSYECTIQDQVSYQRMKTASRNNSVSSVSSVSSVDSVASTASDKN